MSPDDTRSYRGEGERALWAAVVQQAIDDLDTDRNSLEHTDAVSFFTSGGEWRQARIDIADRLGIHADDLERCGRRIMAELGIAEIIPAPRVAAASVPVPVATPPAPLPTLVATFNPEAVKPGRQPKPTRDRNWWISRFLASQAA